MADNERTAPTSSPERALAQAAYGIDPVKNPKAMRSTERAIAGELVTTDEPATNASPNIQGKSEDTPPSNPLRYSNTELNVDTGREASDKTPGEFVFDAANPEDVTLSDLKKHVASLSAEDVRRAQENDGRQGARDIYAARLRELDEE